MDSYDVAIVGGGPAGLSGAVTLGRARRSVVVVDGREPRNAPATGIHGFLTRDGMPPQDFLATGREEARHYGATFVDSLVVGASGGAGEGFVLELAGGGGLRARRLLITTGLVDALPDVPGVRELWGGDVVHCPYCHGWEIRGRPIGVLGSSPMAVHQGLLFSQWSDDVILFTHTAPPLEDEQRAELAAGGVVVIDAKVESLEIDGGGRLAGVRLADGDLVPRGAVAVAPRFVARSELAASLGVEVADHPMGVGSHLATIDPTGRTAVPGVWVAGNVADLFAQVVSSAAAGVMAAAAVNYDLILADVRAR